MLVHEERRRTLELLNAEIAHAGQRYEGDVRREVVVVLKHIRKRIRLRLYPRRDSGRIV